MAMLGRRGDWAQVYVPDDHTVGWTRAARLEENLRTELLRQRLTASR